MTPLRRAGRRWAKSPSAAARSADSSRRRTSSWSPGGSRPLALDLDVRLAAAAVLLMCPPRGAGPPTGSSGALCATRRTTVSLFPAGRGSLRDDFACQPCGRPCEAAGAAERPRRAAVSRGDRLDRRRDDRGRSRGRAAPRGSRRPTRARRRRDREGDAGVRERRHRAAEDEADAVGGGGDRLEQAHHARLEAARRRAPGSPGRRTRSRRRCRRRPRGSRRAARATDGGTATSP